MKTSFHDHCRNDLIAVITAVGVSVFGQGTFQNLDFEDASPVVVAGSPYYPYTVTAASALPDWTASISGVQQTDIIENDPTLGASSVELIGPNDRSGTATDGNYSVLLEGIFPNSTASISQTGLVPSGTESLFFEGSDGGFGRGVGSQLNLFVGTQSLPFAAIGGGPNYTLYGANISGWAGQTEQLTFSAPGGTFNAWEIDDISFSPVSITPEPETYVLMGIAGFLFTLYRRFSPK